MRFILLLVLAALSAPSMVRAEDCSRAADQAAMNDCVGRDVKKSDAELNVLYKQIEARLKDDAATKKLLVVTQRAWIAFRDAECDFATSGASGGTIRPMLFATCSQRLTSKRIADFRSYLNCPEGDLGCPVPGR